jgi:type 1 glutamine amidotransferase
MVSSLWLIVMKMVKTFFLLCVLVLSLSQAGIARDNPDWKKVKVLVYTKNGKGYVHDNIPNAINCVRRLGQQLGFKVEVSDQPSVFTESNIKQYTALIFLSTNNDVFDTPEQRLVFRRYIEAGGGFVGIHSVIGTERNWKWFKMMLGGTFIWHPKFQSYSIKVIAAHHPSTKGLPKIWQKSDECYFMKELYPGTEVLLAQDLTTLSADEGEKIRAHAAPFAELYPAAWYHNFDGGHIWISALGHDKKDYEDPIFVQHLRQGLAYIVGKVNRVNYQNAYAGSWDEPLRY